jgi:hypothetical protein|tara:strand:+ start:372 stop:791 length:420 start_codon:yes stop_codon:yes gene_type:complete
MEEELVGSVDLSSMAATYIKIRDKRNDLRRAYEADDVALANDMKVLESEMLEVCKQSNAESIRTTAGTIIRSIKSRYTTSDWDSMYRFIQEHDAYGLLEKRLHQTHMKQFLEENPELLPMGLNVDREYTVVVRRPTEGK